WIAVLGLCRRLDLLLSRFFFSSRRRHTRFSRDWSSDVCSSDLDAVPGEGAFGESTRESALPWDRIRPVNFGRETRLSQALALLEIGRASCRERADIAAGAVAVPNNDDQSVDTAGDGRHVTPHHH